MLFLSNMIKDARSGFKIIFITILFLQSSVILYLSVWLLNHHRCSSLTFLSLTSSFRLTICLVVSILFLNHQYYLPFHCSVSNIMSLSLGLSFQSPGGSASEIFAKLEVYLWLGLAKYSKEALNCLPEDFMPVYEDEDEEQRRLVPTGKRKLPVSLSCQGESADSSRNTALDFLSVVRISGICS